MCRETSWLVLSPGTLRKVRSPQNRKNEKLANQKGNKLKLTKNRKIDNHRIEDLKLIATKGGKPKEGVGGP